MSAGGLLAARCDPYGAESRIQLLGGIYPENHVGRIMWHCQARAEARYRMICRGGEYGTRMAPGGPVAGFLCDGGHQGQVMALCRAHRQEIGRRQAGMCPACAYPAAARTQIAGLEDCLRRQQSAELLFDFRENARLTLLAADLTAGLDEMRTSGVIHQCPLELVEVS